MNLELLTTQYESAIRLSVFLGVFTLVAIWEVFAPKRKLLSSKTRRWMTNISLVFINTFVLRILFPVAAIGVATYAEINETGLFNQIEMQPALAILLSILLLDFLIYWQHRLFHVVPVLWKLHRVHHADTDYDVTTGSRFHPFEIILSMLIKCAAILVLGAPIEAVLVFEVLLNALAMFNHGNIQLPFKLDKILRIIIVTPDMHRVHHSVYHDEMNSNFGFQISAWDHLFGSYKMAPKDGHLEMKIGLDETVRNPQVAFSLIKMLYFPFKKS